MTTCALWFQNEIYIQNFNEEKVNIHKETWIWKLFFQLGKIESNMNFYHFKWNFRKSTQRGGKSKLKIDILMEI